VLPNQEPFLGVLHIKGAITKSGGWCSYGCDDWAKQVEQYAQDEICQGIILRIDSGGGEALASVKLNEAILSAKEAKPVLAFVDGTNGLCASAAYDIASHATEIYASHKYDRIGSIGTYMSFADWQGAYEKMGVKFHEIYADKSSEKNRPIREALQSKYELVKEDINEINEDFLRRVMSYRPDIQDDKKVFAGKLYNADKALKIGLIDGVKSFDEVVARAFELHENLQNISTYNNLNMDDKQSKGLIAKTIEAMSGYVPKTDFEALKADKDKIVGEMQSKLDELTSKLTAETKRANEAEALAKSYGSQPGAMHTEVKSSGKEIEVDNEALAEYNRISEQVEASVKGGGEWM